MMKSYMSNLHVRFLLISAALIVMPSCDIMNRQPIDEVHVENWFKDASSLHSWMNYCYTEFDTQASMLDNADDIVGNLPSELLAGGRNAARQTWDWTVLSQINRFFEYKDLCKDKDAVARYDAEAHFFRALFYFNKVRMFGDVPGYKLAGGNNPSMCPARTSRLEVMDDVIEDFLYASGHLTDEVFDIPTRINKWVALGYLARAALFEGTFMKYSSEEGWEEYLETAVSACESIMESGLFEVYSSSVWQSTNAYRNLFAMETMSPKEALMLQLFNSSDCPSALDRIYGGENRLGATSRFINHYQVINGAGITSRSGYETEDINEVYQGRDLRLVQTILFPGAKEMDTGNAIPNTLSSITGYQPIKFRKTADAAKVHSCFPLLRYSEILLIYAEAKAELGTVTQNDLDKSVNLTRARVGMPPLELLRSNARPDELLASYYPNVPKVKNRGIILEIRRERTIELVLEGHRQWDMLRWHEGAQLGNASAALEGLYIKAPGLVDLTGDGVPDVELYENTPSQSVLKALKIGTDIVLSEKTKGHIIAHAETALPAGGWNEDRDYLWPLPASEFAVPGCRLDQNYGY